MKILTSLLLLLTCSTIYAHADVRIIVGACSITKKALVDRAELPDHTNNRQVMDIIQKNNKVLEGVIELGKNPTKDQVLEAFVKPDKHSVTWTEGKSTIDFTGKANCDLEFGLPMCTLLGEPYRGAQVNEGKSCLAKCGNVNSLALLE